MTIPFELSCQFVVQSVGATGSALGQIVVAANTGTALTGTSPLTAAAAIDTTASRIIELTTISGAASTTWVYHSATIEIVEI